MIVHDDGYVIAATADGFTFTTDAGVTIPTCPALPRGDGDIRTCHDARIAPDTIIPAWYGDKLNLDLAIWACFANARIADDKAKGSR